MIFASIGYFERKIRFGAKFPALVEEAEPWWHIDQRLTDRSGETYRYRYNLLVGVTVSFVVGFLYNFGQAMFPDLAYVILFLPMVLVLVLRPQGLFGKVMS